ncbi:MAG: glycosyltransferase [Microcoleus sp. PH2017_10_PVI_O_A]|uniref:hormogonium polysaccharide biosynthesis glycosyltransferase HpsP n=1 Tax=unclassified Microcoleus TaxID=2642155 RepID=UPI001D6CB285|nr:MULTISPECIES: hormogonium polysaccharide biosynthesis glycosyltransferase HpsP [unclassified Microcoleus]TAE80942.1 MAG: glycosyltransferase [Oscillatoriales cyanobacterium]MCC3407349.1 glycosyltransferase [Microcoleus sp. PH2017_10_PVI_O_A]MCC3461415.1 glycosyltransferase [Microcoleus sp. PH2017_11_PCY_U_A]MCC3479890.1 glycosyltransferase [Microcoleus sp. PH2017_12_PCY_D_A]MCC3530560.1 glycosyltransferase [Microcoleus sp. PH2017_21_RUC_O_A]
MRILQIIPSISLVYGGPSQMVLGLSAALASQGIDVTIITTDSNGDIGQHPLDVPLNQPIKQNGYQIIYFRCSPFRRYKFSLSLLQWLNQNARQFDLAHIHALFSPVTTFAATIARYHKLPYIMRPCGMLDPADLQKKKFLKQIYAAILERPNLAGAAAIHFTSKQEAKISERFGLDSTGKMPVSQDFLPLDSTGKMPVSQDFLPQDLVIPLGVTADLYPKILPDSEIPIILFLSRIEPKKGLELLISALETILKNGINFQFILAGSNPQDADYESKIKEQIQNSSLGKFTTITGFVSGDSKIALLRKADLFVLPSYYENFGIAVAEAMAAGVPVVISDRVYISDDIQQAEAGWVAPLEVGAIARAIASALLSPPERQRRGFNAQAYAKKYYNWEAIARQTIDAYQHILASIN